MSSDSKSPKELGAASYSSGWEDSADDAQYWVAQHLAARRASHQAPFRTQSFPLIVEALAKDPTLDPNEAFFFEQPPYGIVTSAALEGLAKVYRGRSFEVLNVVEKPTRKIKLPPGSRMLSIANVIFFFSPNVRERFGQAVADFREEHYAALQEGKHAKIRRIFAQHWGGFLIAVFLELANMVGRVYRAVKGAD
jgi:hypothetical protein